MNEQRTISVGNGLFTISIEKASDGGWSAHSVEPEVVGGLGETQEAALADWEEAMGAWLVHTRLQPR